VTNHTDTKKCPGCAEDVRSAARKCRFCGFVFPESSDDQPSLELLDAEPELKVEVATEFAPPMQASRPMGRTQARIILGLLIALVVYLGHLDFWVTVACTALALLIYAAWLGEAGKNKTKAVQDKQIVCAQCHSVGCITTSRVKLKKGISGSKATGAILTGGVSLLAVGLSRKEDATEAKCSNCGSVWHF
jgi:hypothetical protein